MLKSQPTIRIVTATEAKNKFGAIIKSAYASDEHLIVEKSGIPVVAIIPMADYQALVNAQTLTAEVASKINNASQRAAARRELSEFLKRVHAEMPIVPEEDEEEAERLIQREVDAVRAARAKQLLKMERKARRTLARPRAISGASSLSERNCCKRTL